MIDIFSSASYNIEAPRQGNAMVGSESGRQPRETLGGNHKEAFPPVTVKGVAAEGPWT